MAAALGTASAVIVLAECTTLACLGSVALYKFLRRHHCLSGKRVVQLPSGEGSWTPYVDREFINRRSPMGELRQSEGSVASSGPLAAEATTEAAVAVVHESDGTERDEDAEERERAERGEMNANLDELGSLLSIIEERGTALQLRLMRRLAGAVAQPRVAHSLELLPTLMVERETDNMRLPPPEDESSL